jgi:pterin-4a-carbinolamine dehydratase
VRGEANGGEAMIQVFISYRRTQAFMAERIHDRICATFRAEQVFLDRSEIKPGTRFPDEINKALESAKIVLVVIDPTWISVQDPVTLKRRLEIRSDWVRIEVQRGLKADKILIPVLIDGARPPHRRQLPSVLADLATRQGIKVDRESFADDVDALVEYIRKKVSECELHDLIANDDHPFPKAGTVRPIAVDGELLDTMMAELSQWKIVESPIENDPRPSMPPMRREIVRSFRFPSFIDAVAFMRSAAGPIEEFGHHPRWENIFKTVKVCLSTWDIGHQLSDRDFKTAVMLERHYARFIGSSPHGHE